MNDRVLQDIEAKGQLQDWADIDWKLVEKRVRNLRRRIFRATESGQWKKVRNLMKLMLRSYSNLLLCVKKVTQENKGRKTSGIDNQTVLTPKARVRLVRQMMQISAWSVKPGKRVYIPKANGKQRPLGILTIKNRVAQAIVKNALEPSWEARFESNSYGFRIGRSCHDAIVHCWIRLKRNSKHKWVLDADVQLAFDNICHKFVLNKLGLVPGRELIKQWLKAGYVEAEAFHATTAGVQQGGVISPLLANVALDGLQNVLAPQAGYIRYADDLVVTARSREELEALVPKVEEFLKERGLSLNAEKTRIVHVQDGFDFLGFHVRSFKGKCIVKPQKAKVLLLLQEIRLWLKSHSTAPPGAVIQHLNPILRGWGNYYKRVNSKRTFGLVDHQIWCALWRWCMHRHPNKSKRWVKRKYFKRIDGRAWTFFAVAKDFYSGKPTDVKLFKTSDLKIVSHRKIIGAASPDNPAQRIYWEKRQAKAGDIR